jgi:hypothetical protein
MGTSMQQNPALSGQPGPGGSCRVCGATLEGSLRCRQCGAAYGEVNRCPHCRSVADLEPHGTLRFRCRVCGGPRVPLEAPDAVRTGREQPLLAVAQSARMRAAAFKVGSASAGGFGLLSLLIALVVLGLASPGFLATLATLVVVAVPLVVSLLAWRRAKRHEQELDRALDDAWALVASDLIRQRGAELTASELAAAMRLSEQQAELLLARLSVQDFVRARVTDDGDIAYSTRDLPLPRARIIAGAEEAELAEHEQSRTELELGKTIVDTRPR